MPSHHESQSQFELFDEPAPVQEQPHRPCPAIDFHWDEYPEALALTPSDDGSVDLTQYIKDKWEKSHPQQPRPDPSSNVQEKSTSRSPVPSPTSLINQSTSSVSNLTTISSSNATYSSTNPIYPYDSVSNRPSLSTPDPIPTFHLRPVPDLLTLFSQLIPTIGDAAPITFGSTPTPPSLFQLPPPPLPKNSIFVEEPITAERQDSLQRERDIYPGQRRIRGTRIKKPSQPKLESGWKGRKYSVNPLMKTRKFTFEVLERRIGHGELLSMHLNDDARRDACLIGGGVADIGGGMALESPKHGETSFTSSESVASSGVVNSGSARSSIKAQTGTAMRRVNGGRSAPPSHLSAIGLDGVESLEVPRFRPRSKSPASLGRVGPKGYVKRKRDRDDEGERPRGRMLETGNYGTGGIMLWRVVKVGAVVSDVVGDGSEREEHFAWWCVPDKAMGGFF